MKNLIIAVLLMVSTSVYADTYVRTKCVPNDIGADVCEIARDAAAELVPYLPLQVSQNFVLVDVVAFGPTLSVHAQLGYTKAELVELHDQVGIDYEETQGNILANTHDYVCNAELLNAFVTLGGEVNYAYTFSDNMVYLIIEVDEC